MKKVVKRILLILLCVVVLVAGYVATYYLVGMNPKLPARQTDKPLVACVGDSITQGFLELTLKRNTYPDKLQALVGDDWQVINFGVSGRTAVKNGDFPYWNEEFFVQSQAMNPDIVTIFLGTNDTKPYNWDADTYHDDLIALIEVYEALPSRPVIYLVAPPAAFVREGADAVAYDIDKDIIAAQVYDIVQEVAKAKHLTVIDLYTPTRDHPELFIDGVHPNDAGNDLIAEAFYSAITW